MEVDFLMPGQHMEYTFETTIEDYLTADGGYEKGDCDGFDALRGLFVGDVIGLINGSNGLKRGGEVINSSKSLFADIPGEIK
jgi:hypothetical protein